MKYSILNDTALFLGTFIGLLPQQQLKPRPVPHLLALTIITCLGCAVSFICCIALIIHLCRKR